MKTKHFSLDFAKNHCIEFQEPICLEENCIKSINKKVEFLGVQTGGADSGVYHWPMSRPGSGVPHILTGSPENNMQNTF